MTAASAEGFPLLTDLALILCVAAVTTVLFQRIKQPVILGYLLAGMIVGPHLPIPLFADEKVAHTLSELGVILLMFALGLDFSLRRLIQIAPTWRGSGADGDRGERGARQAHSGATGGLVTGLAIARVPRAAQGVARCSWALLRNQGRRS